ncbi:MAG: hypothetical protein ABIR79_10095 [Candidatus Binatia bacterium]
MQPIERLLPVERGDDLEMMGAQEALQVGARIVMSSTRRMT